MAGVSLGLYIGDSLQTSSPTISNGRYYFTGLAAGTYSVRPGQTGKVFTPVSRSVTVPPTVSTADFVISEVATGSTISGQIKNGGGAGLSSISVGLYQGDSLKLSALTNGEGRYTFSNVAAGTYTVRPARTGVTFDPLSREVTVPPAATGIDFTGAHDPDGQLYLGSPQERRRDGALSGVSVGLYQGDSLKRSTTTNGEGRYTFSNVAAGTYTVKPVKEGVVFDPLSRTIAVPPTVANADFTGRTAGSVICGTIRNGEGVGVGGVSVGLYQGDTLKSSTTSLTNGRYYLTGRQGRLVRRAAGQGRLDLRPGLSRGDRPAELHHRRLHGSAQAPAFAHTPRRPGHPGERARAPPTSPTTSPTPTRSTAIRGHPGCASTVKRFVTMVKYDDADTDYTNGCVFIARAFLGVGTHDYRFMVSTPAFVVRLPLATAGSVFVGPTVEGDASYAISGVITAGDVRLEGVTVTLTTEGRDPRLGGADQRRGALLRPAPGGGGQYVVTPTLEGYSFDPADRTVGLPPTVVTCNFSATSE